MVTFAKVANLANCHIGMINWATIGSKLGYQVDHHSGGPPGATCIASKVGHQVASLEFLYYLGLLCCIDLVPGSSLQIVNFPNVMNVDLSHDERWHIFHQVLRLRSPEKNVSTTFISSAWAQAIYVYMYTLDSDKIDQVSPPRLLGVGFLVHNIYDDTW